MVLGAVAVTATGAAALTFDFPGPAQTTLTRSEAMASAVIPAGAWDGALPRRPAEGQVDRQAWRIDAPGISTLALLVPLRDQLRTAGYDVVFECETAACGGFDFRYALDLLPEPEMHVDLGDFRYLTAERGAEVVGLMVSRSATAGFVQVTRVAPAGQTPLAAPAAPLLAAAVPVLPRIAGATGGLAVNGPGTTVSLSSANAPAPVGDLAARLDQAGGAVLEDLVFASGASTLEQGDYATLRALADWLRADPARRVTLVGHTDASGGLEGNIALSRRRAEAVREVLVRDMGVARAQVMAEGVGFLSPRATNDTDEGRHLNRRVEAVVTAGN